MKKTSLYDNPSGYGHGGLGYDQSLDTLPTQRSYASNTSGWLPWAGLAGAGVLGVMGLRGLGKAFRRGAKAAPKVIDPAAAYEREMLGRVNPRVERMATDAEEAMAAQKARLAREESLKPFMEQGSPTLQKSGSALLSALGRIARGY